MNTVVAVVSRLHNLVLHFPIALVIAVVVIEVVLRKRIAHDRRIDVVRALLVLCTASAVVAVISGLAYADTEGFHGDELAKAQLHRNLGIGATALLALCTFVYFKKRWRKVALPSLLLAMAAVVITAHRGGTLVHGDDFFTAGFVRASDADSDVKKSTDGDHNDAPVAATDGDEAADIAARDRFPEGATPDKPDYLTHIKPLLDRSCTKCHGAEKRKSGLRLDKKRFAMKGGETGAAIVPGDAKTSLLFKYVSLPADDEDVMPSKGKLLALSEIETLRKWIDSGAAWPDDAAAP